MKVKLTAMSLAALKPKEKRYEVGDQEPGLRVLVMPTGAKSFVVRYKCLGKVGKLTLGPVDDYTLTDAREAAREAMKMARRGEDPARRKQEDKAAKLAAVGASENLVENAAEAFIAGHVRGKKSGHEVERLFRTEVIPAWKGTRVEEKTRRDVIRLLDAIVARGAPTTANRVRANLSKFFNWMIAKDYDGLERNPCMGTARPVEEVKRDRVLTSAELRLVMLASDTLDTPWREFIRLLVYTAARRSEVAEAPRDEFDALDGEAVWTLPAERTKNGRPHLLPLPREVAAMLEAMPAVTESPFMFTVTGTTPLCAFSAMKAKIDAAMVDIANREAAERGQPADYAVKPWRLHDLRRTAATGMASIGIAPHVVEAVLNHVSGTMADVAGIYNRYAYQAEKKAALAAWAAHVTALETGQPAASNVVPIRA